MRKLSALFVALLAPATLFAHRMDARAIEINGERTLEVAFQGGAPVIGADVKITNPAGDIVVQGITDGEGLHPIPSADHPLYIVVSDNAGHRAELNVPAYVAKPTADSSPADPVDASPADPSPADPVAETKPAPAPEKQAEEPKVLSDSTPARTTWAPLWVRISVGVLVIGLSFGLIQRARRKTATQ